MQSNSFTIINLTMTLKPNAEEFLQRSFKPFKKGTKENEEKERNIFD